MLRPPADTPWLWRGIVATLFVATLLLYARALNNDFVNYDDPDYVTSNAHVKAGLTAAGVKWAMTSGEASNWHPLTWISHMIDVSLFGMNPRGHHATSVLLHALNAALAFAAFARLTGAIWASALTAALFAWHPLRVESVAWVAERKDVLSGTFGFIALWSYAKYAENRRSPSTGGRRWGCYGLSLAAFALGLMAKPMLVTLPCVLLLLDFWPLRRLALVPAGVVAENRWGIVAEKVPFLVLAALSSFVTYVVQRGGGSVSAALSLQARLENAVVAIARYLGKFFWPHDLAVLYPHPGQWGTPVFVACLGLFLTITMVAVWQRRKRPWLAVGWLWFVGTLVPVVGIVQVGLQSMADRYTYIPILGLQLALVWTLAAIAPARPGDSRWLTIGATVMLASCAVQTWRQVGVWKNSFTLFDHAIAATEKNYLAHDNRGLFLFKAGRIEEALADYRRSLAINPSYLNAHNNLGYALSQLGRPAEAIPEYRAALKTNSNHLEVRNNLANALSDVGQLAEAMEHYEFVLARRPDHVNALNGSAVVLAMQNRLADARARLEKSLQLDPANASACNNLGNVHSMLGQRDDAIRCYRRAAELNPGDAHPHFLIGSLLVQQGKFADAVSSFERSLALRPQNPDALAQLGFAYAKLGDRERALHSLRNALQQQPNHPSAKAWLDAMNGTPSGR